MGNSERNLEKALRAIKSLAPTIVFTDAEGDEIDRIIGYLTPEQFLAQAARIQTDLHFGGVTVSTLAEAQAFADGGFTDITYAVCITPNKFEHAVNLIERGADLFHGQLALVEPHRIHMLGQERMGILRSIVRHIHTVGRRREHCEVWWTRERICLLPGRCCTKC